MGRNVTTVAWKNQSIPFPLSGDVIWCISSVHWHLFVKRGSWDRILRVDVHMAVKMLSRKVEFISVCVTHPLCGAGHLVCLQLFTLVILSPHSYVCICETELPASLWTWSQRSWTATSTAVALPFCFIFLLFWKSLHEVSPILVLWMQHLYLRSRNSQSPFPVALLTASLGLSFPGSVCYVFSWFWLFLYRWLVILIAGLSSMANFF